MGVVKRRSGGAWVDAGQILRKAGSQAPVSTFTVRSGGKWNIPTPPPPPTTSLNIPADTLIRGVNIGPQWVGANEPGFDEFQQMWSWFSGGAPDTSQGTPVGYGGWSTWWKPSLDAAATVGNCARIIGDPAVVLSGLQSLATYLANWRTILDYCVTKKLYVYATNIGFERWGAWSGSLEANVTPVLAAWATMLSSYRNVVIGIDVTNEAVMSATSGLDGTAQPFGGDANSAAKTAMLLNVGSVIRTNSGLPITYSSPVTSVGQVRWDFVSAGWFPHSTPLLAASDFIDLHLYASPMLTPADLAVYYTNSDGLHGYSAGKQIFHGEFGANTTMSPADRTAFVTGVSKLVSSVPYDLGALLWQEFDFNQTGAPAANQYGLWPTFGAAIRTDIGTPFATIPVTTTPVTPPQPPVTDTTPYLAFDMSTAPSNKVVLGHITPWFPVSIDNKDPASDYYTTQWMTPGGEGGNYAAYGGRLRDRPWRRPPISGDWKLEDCRAEIVQAKSVGIDAFTIDLVSMSHKATVDKYFQAAAMDNFKCLPQSDMSPNTPYASMSEANYVAEIQPYLTHAASFKLPDGRPVLNCFLGETRTTTWWANVKSILASNGVNVALILTQLSPGTVASYAPLCYAISIWGSGTPGGTATAATAGPASAARNAGAKWMAPIRFQDVRPALACYWESGNGQAYRQSWDGAIQQADLAQLITWNDYNEGTQIARSDKHGWRHLDRMAYDIARFKYGSYPTVVRDCVYFTHRSQWLNSQPQYATSKPMTPQSSDAQRNNVEVEVFAKAPATLQTTIGGSPSSVNVPAGFSVYTYPLAAGTVSVTLIRDGTPAYSATSPYPVTNTPYVQDFQYLMVGGLR